MRRQRQRDGPIDETDRDGQGGDKTKQQDDRKLPPCTVADDPHHPGHDAQADQPDRAHIDQCRMGINPLADPGRERRRIAQRRRKRLAALGDEIVADMPRPHGARVRRVAGPRCAVIRGVLRGLDQSPRHLDLAVAAVARQRFHLAAILVAGLDGHLRVHARRVQTEDLMHETERLKQFRPIGIIHRTEAEDRIAAHLVVGLRRGIAPPIRQLRVLRDQPGDCRGQPLH